MVKYACKIIYEDNLVHFFIPARKQAKKKQGIFIQDGEYIQKLEDISTKRKIRK